MHITKDAGILNAHGVPYYFDKFDVIGQIPDSYFFEQSEKEGKPHIINKSSVQGPHVNELPTDGQVIAYAVAAKTRTLQCSAPTQLP